jgi:hypothetical protein
MNKKIANELAVGIILLLAIIVGGIFWLQNKKQMPTETAMSIVQKQPASTPTVPVTQPEKKSQAENYIKLAQYDNPDIGIHFQYPTEIYTDLIKCNEPMPIEINPTKETYGQTGFYYEIGVGTHYPFAGNKNCESLPFSLGYTVYVGDVSSTKNLEQLIKRVYGSDCKLTIEKFNGETNYDVDLGDWISDKSNCFISGKGGIWEYSPKKKKAILFETGQDFPWDKQSAEDFINSIKLL